MQDPLPRSMKALVYRGTQEVHLEHIEVPEIGPGEILVRVAACGVCPSDLKKVAHGTVPPPRIFGHEIAGRIVQIGANVTGWKIGDRVAVHHHVPCRACRYCDHGAYAQCAQFLRTGTTAGFEPAGGGFSEFVRVMDFCLPGVVQLPEDVSFTHGALMEPVNTVLKAVRRLRLIAGDAVVVVGQGPMGLLFTRLLSQAGMDVVGVDLRAHCLEVARELGALRGVNPKSLHDSDEMDQLSREREGFDAAILTVPARTALNPALRWIRPGGQVLLFGDTMRDQWLNVDVGALAVSEKEIITSYSADVSLQDEVLSLIQSQTLRLDRLITHLLPLSQGVKALACAQDASGHQLRVMVVSDDRDLSPR